MGVKPLVNLDELTRIIVEFEHMHRSHKFGVDGQTPTNSELRKIIKNIHKVEYSRESISRKLKYLENLGRIKRTKNGYKIVNKFKKK